MCPVICQHDLWLQLKASWRNKSLFTLLFMTMCFGDVGTHENIITAAASVGLHFRIPARTAETYGKRTFGRVVNSYAIDRIPNSGLGSRFGARKRGLVLIVDVWQHFSNSVGCGPVSDGILFSNWNVGARFRHSFDTCSHWAHEWE